MVETHRVLVSVTVDTEWWKAREGSNPPSPLEKPRKGLFGL